MAYLKNFQSQQFAAEFPGAYHRVTVHEKQAHYGVIVLHVDVFASKQAASPPPPTREIARDAEGNLILLEDRTDYVWVDVPSTQRSQGNPIGSYQVQVWNRQPLERKAGDGGPEFVVDAAAFNALTGKGAPIAAPQGTPDKEKFAPKAQAYRLLKSLPSLADAVDDK